MVNTKLADASNAFSWVFKFSTDKNSDKFIYQDKFSWEMGAITENQTASELSLTYDWPCGIDAKM